MMRLVMCFNISYSYEKQGIKLDDPYGSVLTQDIFMIFFYTFLILFFMFILYHI